MVTSGAHNSYGQLVVLGYKVSKNRERFMQQTLSTLAVWVYSCSSSCTPLAFTTIVAQNGPIACRSSWFGTRRGIGSA